MIEIFILKKKLFLKLIYRYSLFDSMGKRGPKSVFTFDDKYFECVKHDIFQDDKVTLKGKTDSVWQDICDALNKKHNPPEGLMLKPTNMYIYVQKDIKKMLQGKKSHSTEVKEKIQPRPYPVSKEEENLIKIRSNALFKPTIHGISVKPFSIFNWSNEAFDYANSSKGQFYFVMNGNFCTKFVSPDGSLSRDILLSTLGITEESGENFIPISQISTEEVSRINVYRFFFECIRSGLKIPASIQVEHLPAFYLATNEMFNFNNSYEKYLVTCFKHLVLGEKLTVNCIITSDVKFLCVRIFHLNSLKNIQSRPIKLRALRSFVKQADRHKGFSRHFKKNINNNEFP